MDQVFVVKKRTNFVIPVRFYIRSVYLFNFGTFV